MPKNKLNFNKICRNVPAALAASVAENVALNEEHKPGPSSGQPTTRVQKKVKTLPKSLPPKEGSKTVKTPTPSGVEPPKVKKGKWGSKFSFPLPKLGEPGGRDDPLRRGLNGATTRRYLRLLHEGVKPEEARARAVSTRQDANTRIAGGKRGSESITPPQKPTVKKPRLGPSRVSPSRSFANTAKCTKVAIVAKNHTEKPLTNDDLSAIEEAIVDELPGYKLGESIKFGGISFRPGMLLINCESNATVDWLRNIIPNLTNWKGEKLVACVGDEIPRDHVAIMYLPRSAERSDSSLLEIISTQNREVSIESWKVLRAKREGGGVLLHIGIDDQSRTQIEKQNFLLSFRFGNIPVNGLKKKKIEEETPSTQSEAGSLVSLEDRMASLGTKQAGDKMDTLEEEEEVEDVLEQMEELLGEAATSSRTAMPEPGSSKVTPSKGELKNKPGDGPS